MAYCPTCRDNYSPADTRANPDQRHQEGQAAQQWLCPSCGCWNDFEEPPGKVLASDKPHMADDLESACIELVRRYGPAGFGVGDEVEAVERILRDRGFASAIDETDDDEEAEG